MLTYVDDCLVIDEDATWIIKILQEEPYDYKLKDVGPPKRYLGAEVGRYSIGTKQTWYMSARLYLREAIKEVERTWGPLEKLFNNRGKLDIPLPTGYHPELDTSKILDEDSTQLYQSYVGIIRWAVEIGRIDICMSAGTMARFSSMPRQGHMFHVLRILAYCKKHLESKIVFDTEEKDFSDIIWLSND